MDRFTILCLGDVVGRPGRRVLRERLPGLRKKFAVAMVMANGENAAGGLGLTPETARELLAAGVDVITSGNHIWKHKSMHPLLGKQENILRPANYGNEVPGSGFCLHRLDCGTQVGVINLIGRSFMNPVNCPFHAADTALEALKEQGADLCLVDFHAEVTSEKIALGYHADGRVSALWGTHTHVQTADERILQKGTGYITDLGMTGARDGVLGLRHAPIVYQFRTGVHEPFCQETMGSMQICGCIFSIDEETGHTTAIRRLTIIEN